MTKSPRVVATTLVDQNPFNARFVYDESVVAQLGRELRADGQLVAAMAVRSTTSPGRFILVDGHYRLRAINAVGLKTILLDVREPVPDVELFRLSFALNEHRAAPTALDNALAWRRLLALGTVGSQAALQAVTGKSISTISKTLQIGDLPIEVLAVIKSCPSRFALRLTYSLVQICKAGRAADAVRIAQRATTEELALADVEAAVERARSGKRISRTRDVSQDFSIEHDGCVGKIRSWSSGKVSAELSFREPARRAQFVEQLKRLSARAE